MRHDGRVTGCGSGAGIAVLHSTNQAVHTNASAHQLFDIVCDGCGNSNTEPEVDEDDVVTCRRMVVECFRCMDTNHKRLDTTITK